MKLETKYPSMRKDGLHSPADKYPPTIEMNEPAFQEGLKAFAEGKQWTENPYSSRSKNGKLWSEGILEGAMNEFDKSEELLKQGMPTEPLARAALTFRLLSEGKGSLLQELIQKEKPTRRGVYHFRFRTYGGPDSGFHIVRVYKRWKLLWVEHSILGRPISQRMDNSLFDGGVWEYILTPSNVVV